MNEYLVEVFPVGHVLPAGHRLLVKISAPPVLDSFYAYVPKTTPRVNTVFHTAAQPSRITLPLVPLRRGARPGAPVRRQEAVRCIPAPNP